MLIDSKLINFAVPDTIDSRVINTGAKLSLFKRLENLTLAITSAQVWNLVKNKEQNQISKVHFGVDF